jgi:hypothetical protein
VCFRGTLVRLLLGLAGDASASTTRINLVDAVVANLQMMRSVLALLALASASGLSRRTGALAVRGGNS